MLFDILPLPYKLWHISMLMQTASEKKKRSKKNGKKTQCCATERSAYLSASKSRPDHDHFDTRPFSSVGLLLFFLVPSKSHVKCLHVQCSGNCMTRVCMDCSLCLSLSWGTPVVENPPCKCSITAWFQNTTGHGDMKTKNLCNVVIVLASLFWPVHLYASSVSLSPVRRSGLASQTESFHLDLKRKKKVKTITMIHKSGHSHSQSTCRSKT